MAAAEDPARAPRGGRARPVPAPVPRLWHRGAGAYQHPRRREDRAIRALEARAGDGHHRASAGVDGLVRFRIEGVPRLRRVHLPGRERRGALHPRCPLLGVGPRGARTSACAIGSSEGARIRHRGVLEPGEELRGDGEVRSRVELDLLGQPLSARSAAPPPAPTPRAAVGRRRPGGPRASRRPRSAPRRGRSAPRPSRTRRGGRGPRRELPAQAFRVSLHRGRPPCSRAGARGRPRSALHPRPRHLGSELRPRELRVHGGELLLQLGDPLGERRFQLGDPALDGWNARSG